MTHEITLAALDGANPLGMLAALGAFRVATLLDDEATMHWVQQPGWRPVLTTQRTEDELVEGILAELHRLAGPAAREKRLQELRGAASKLEKEKAKKGKNAPAAERRAAIEAEESVLASGIAALEAPGQQPGLGLVDAHDLVAVAREEYRRHAEPALRASIAPTVPCDADFYAALGCDGILKEKNGVGPAVEPTPFSFSNGGSGKCLLKDFRNCAARASAPVLGRILSGKMEKADELTSLLWDPADQQSYALRWTDPGDSKNKAKCNATANALAFLGLACVPAVPHGTRLRAVGMDNRLRRWAWPLWGAPLDLATTRALLATPAIQDADAPGAARTLAALGIHQVYASRRFFLNKRPFFSPARAL